MSEPKPTVPKWMRRCIKAVIKQLKGSPWSDNDELIDSCIPSFAAAYAPEQARLRRELLALVKEWSHDDTEIIFHPKPSHWRSRCRRCQIESFVDRELPLKEGKG